MFLGNENCHIEVLWLPSCVQWGKERDLTLQPSQHSHNDNMWNWMEPITVLIGYYGRQDSSSEI